MSELLECVVNLSEGRRPEVIAGLAAAAGACLLDVHADADHHRSVLTMAGPSEMLVESVRALTTAAVARLDVSGHRGAHPRIGVVDVVPWVPFRGWPLEPAPLGPAVRARDDHARWAGDALALPCFLYGPERSLPELRRQAWTTLAPDTGPDRRHPTAGASAIGARPALVAYNLWLARPELDVARAIAADLRGPFVRALALAVGGAVQVSCNLIEPARFGPAAAFDAVASRTDVDRAELVGLAPGRVLDATARHRWQELDLDRSRTIEARLEQAGLGGSCSGHT